MSVKGLKWRGCTIVGVILLVSLASLQTAAVAQGPVVEKDPYLVRTFIDEEGRQIDEIIVPGRPPAIKAEAVAVPEPHIAMGINNLANVPAFDWSYGCSATSGAMMAGYYDRTGYPNVYTGPTNGGVCPMDNSVWGHTWWIDEWWSECPLSATHQGKDGRETRGHVDDYWIDYGSTAQDPFITNGWPEHTYGDCTGDHMKTNQYNYGNSDGSTTFYFFTDGSPLYDYQMEGYGIDDEDGGYGLKLFFESRGYVVTTMYNQYILGYVSSRRGFTFNQYKAEIDAGRPVIIQVKGHSMLGYGYSDPNTVYLHDTWDYSDHSMTWGGSYSGMQHYGVTVIQLGAVTPCGTMGVNPTSWSPTVNAGLSASQTVTISATDGSVNGVNVSKVSGPTWLTFTPSSLGDIAAETNKNLTMTAAPPANTSGDFPYTVRVNNTCSTPTTENVTGTIHVGMCGDVTCDGVVDVSDLVKLLYYVGYPGDPQYSICNRWAANVNCDQSIDVSDLIKLLYDVGYPGDPRYTLNCCETS